MLANQGQAATHVTLLNAVSAANTAAATSAWIDARAYEGDLVFVLDTGVVTAGNIVWTVEDATDGAGAGAATIAFNEGAATTVTTGNDPLGQKRTISASAVRGWVRCVGTITTGPALVAVHMLAHPKYT
jgi:hypothetical protein